MGIKPLYYAEIGGRILFASELKSILQVAGVERKLNWGAMSHVFTFLSTPPTDAIIDGVHKLEPGHLLTATPGRVACRLSATGIWNSSRIMAGKRAISSGASVSFWRNRFACIW